MALANQLWNNEAENSVLMAPFSEMKGRFRSLRDIILCLDALETKHAHEHMTVSRQSWNSQRVEMEAVKFLHQLIQESKDEPTMQAIKLYLTLKKLRSQGQERSLSYRAASRALENIAYQHGLDIDGLTGYIAANVPQRETVAKKSAYAIVCEAARARQFMSCASACEMTTLKESDQEGTNVLSANEKRTTRDNGSLQSREMMPQDSSFQQPVMASIESENITSALKQRMEDSSRKRTLDAKSPSKIEPSKFRDSSSQESVMLFNDMNRGNAVLTEQNVVTGSRKRGTARTLDQEYGINRDILEKHSGKKLEDVAAILGVSRSTLKRICRRYHIFRWPPFKAKKDKRPLQKFVQATQRNPSAFGPWTTVDAKSMEDDGRIMVKATHGDDIFKFQLSCSSTKLDLEKEISTRLKLSVGSFKIKYLDKDNDWVSIACDADLTICIFTLTSLRKTTVKIMVDKISP